MAFLDFFLARPARVAAIAWNCSISALQRLLPVRSDIKYMITAVRYIRLISHRRPRFSFGGGSNHFKKIGGPTSRHYKIPPKSIVPAQLNVPKKNNSTVVPSSPSFLHLQAYITHFALMPSIASATLNGKPGN